MADAVPMRRMRRLQETTAAVGYFLSDAAGFTTGQTLLVCGEATTVNCVAPGRIGTSMVAAVA
ncbi:hypothetical protein [Roseomonas xinghualingensis]|uniref:hypothetical protein n=1 Tax=Roseomonas xinghualingensis TaxID=2986475 RepID=UPI0021F1CCBE|nr:hypothetical protein [Roseomonas sp. SXEYE001]MCV4210216.1 hypothetical protein [Roseomonas sp. SXEYE001]